MGMVVVILLNILIAQLSYTYAEAKKTAKLQYAVDRMFIVSRLETSRFARFVSAIFDRSLAPFLSYSFPSLPLSLSLPPILSLSLLVPLQLLITVS